MHNPQTKTSPGPELRPIDPTAYRFRTGRPALLLVGGLLAALGIWGVLANVFGAASGPTGAPAAGLHLTTLHATVLLATGLLALVGSRNRRTALIFTSTMFGAYLLLFVFGAVLYARDTPTAVGFDAADNILHVIVMLTGLALAVWFAAGALEGRWWVRTGDSSGTQPR